MIDNFIELRKTIIYCLIVLMTVAAILFPLSDILFTMVLTPLYEVMPESTKLISVDVLAPVMSKLLIVFYVAFCISLPFILFFIWRFVSPALYIKEKLITMAFVLSGLLMFFIGMVYCYFVVFKGVFLFICNFAPDEISVAPDITSYLSFFVHMLLAFGLTFETPVFVFILCKSGLVSAKKLSKSRRYVIVAAFALSAVITPPDISSQFLLAVPLILLFEVGLMISRIEFLRVRLRL